MLQKLSKCEVKARLCWNSIILPPLQFYVKSNFCGFKRSKNVIFGNFRDCELENVVNLGLESCSNLLKSKFRTSKIAKNDNFGSFECTKMWFHVKSKWRYNDQISIKSSLIFTFWKFLEHSVLSSNHMNNIPISAPKITSNSFEIGYDRGKVSSMKNLVNQMV